MILICADCEEEYERIKIKYSCIDGKLRCKKCSNRKYKKSEKGKASEKKYQSGYVFRLTQARYHKTDKCREARLRLYQKNIDKERKRLREKQQKRYWADPEYHRMKALANIHGIDKTKLQQIIERDKVCQCCGSKDNLTFDHKHPVSKGGKSNINNLQILCNSCNAFKKDRLFTPFPGAGILIGVAY